MKIISSLLMASVPLVAFVARSETEEVDGVKWSFTIHGDYISLGSSDTQGLAISQETTGAITIPSALNKLPVRIISSKAFSNCKMRTVSIPSTITNIEDRAFEKCLRLMYVYGGDNVEYIGRGAFYGCSWLLSMTIPSSVKNTGTGIFESCSRLSSVVIQDGLTKIENYTFEFCTGLTGISIPTSVKEIGRQAFYGCRSLGNVNLPSSVESIGLQAFYECSSMTNVEIPSSVVSIEDSAFENCSGITSVRILANLKSIGGFSGCKGLKTVQIPSCAVEIQSAAFRDCVALETITLPDCITNIGVSAFSGCTTLKSINIPSNVENIGEGAFRHCSALGSGLIIKSGWLLTVNDGCIPNAEIPSGVRAIVGYAFAERSEIVSVSVPSSVMEIGKGAFYKCPNLTSVIIDKGLVEIGEMGFYFCSNLMEIEIPSSVRQIGNEAFRYCSKLKAMPIEEGVVEIGKYAFLGCSALEAVTIPSTTKFVGTSAFGDCVSLKSAKVASGGTIGKSAFEGCTALSSVELSSAMSEIPDRMFYGCKSIENVVVPMSVTNIGERAFYGCVDMKTVEMSPSICFIGSKAFMLCDALEKIVVPQGDVERVVRLLKESGFQRTEIVSDNAVAMPEIKSYFATIQDGNETNVLIGSCLIVKMKCNTEDAVIRYTIDGSEPTVDSKIYCKPFKVNETTTIKAIAYKQGLCNSDVAVFEIVKRWTIGDALNLPDAKFTFSGAAEWVTDSAVSHDGVASARSGAIRRDKETVIKTTVSGSGKIMFYWKASCEKTPAPPWYYDNGTFKVDGKEVAWIDGIMEDWERCEIAIAGSGEHDLEWMYSKDDSEVFGDDCVWVDQVTWIPDADAVTVKSEVPVSFKWLYDKGLLNNDDPESAVMKKTGKLDGAGRELTVEDEFVSGTDPTKAESHFRVGIEFEDGKPIVKWEPDLNEGGTKHLRNYTTWGCQALGGQWVDYNAVPDADKELYKFFKVTVSMP